MFSECIICSNIINPVGDINVTMCGHIFHQKCLAEWLNRTNTCPQCEKSVSAAETFLLYPKLSSKGGEDAVSLLQTCLDDAQMQINKHKAECKEKEDKLAEISNLLKQNQDELSLYKVKVDMLEQEDIDTLKHENEVTKRNLNAINVQLATTFSRLRAKESEAMALTEQVRELPSFVQSIKSLEQENETLKQLIQSMKSKLDIAREYIESQRACIVCLKEQLKLLPEPKNDEAIRLNKENKALMKNIQALDGILTIIKEKLARRETTISNLQDKVKRLEAHKEQENVRIMNLWETLNAQKNQTPTCPALPQGASSLNNYLKREAESSIDDSEIPEKKLLKGQSDPSDNIADRSSDSSDDSDCDPSYDSDLELLDCYSHDPLSLYGALMTKRFGPQWAGDESKEEEDGETKREVNTSSSLPAVANFNADKKI